MSDSTKKNELASAGEFTKQRRAFLQGAIATAGVGVASTLNVGCGSDAEAEGSEAPVRRPRATTVAELYTDGYLGEEFTDEGVADQVKALTLGQLDDQMAYNSILTEGGTNHFEVLTLTEDDHNVVSHLFASAHLAQMENLASATSRGTNAHAEDGAGAACCCCTVASCCCCYAAQPVKFVVGRE